MKCCVGIDLGSTTTKAVILDGGGVVVGRGITNSRSSYDVACQVALTEALVDTRFWLVASALEETGIDEQRKKRLLAELERSFRKQQYLGQLRTLGRVLRELLARDGFGVVINYHTNREAAGMVRDRILGEGGEAVVRQFDVADQRAVNETVVELTRTEGPIQVLVNNAAIAQAQLFLRMSDEAWHRVINTDLNSVYYCTKAVVRAMAGTRRPGRRIVNISSLAGEIGLVGAAHYSAAKAGIIGFTKTIARELAPLGITVNAVAPGPVKTDLIEHAAIDEVVKEIPLGRVGQPEDVSSVVSFLVSERAAYITGQVIRVNGGFWM